MQILNGILKVKAFYLILIDAEILRWEKEIGLETLVPPTVNDEWWIISFI